MPINSDVLGDQAKQSLPYISQLFISSIEKNLQLEPLLFQAQKDLENIYKNYEEFLFSKERETHQLEIENFYLKEVDWIDGTFIVNKEKIE